MLARPMEESKNFHQIPNPNRGANRQPGTSIYESVYRRFAGNKSFSLSAPSGLKYGLAILLKKLDISVRFFTVSWSNFTFLETSLEAFLCFSSRLSYTFSDFVINHLFRSLKSRRRTASSRRVISPDACSSSHHIEASKYYTVTVSSPMHRGALSVKKCLQLCSTHITRCSAFLYSTENPL